MQQYQELYLVEDDDDEEEGIEGEYELVYVPIRRPFTLQRPMEVAYAQDTELLVSYPDYLDDDDEPTAPAMAWSRKRSSALLALFLAIALPVMALMSIRSTDSTTEQKTAAPLAPKQSVASGGVPYISQLDRGQYTSAEEYATWSSVACSTASMTAVFDSYGFQLKIADVLHVQQNEHGITSAGAVGGVTMFERMGKHYGFSVQDLRRNWEKVTQALRSQRPVIVAVTGSQWPYGHYIVLKSIAGDTIQVMDPWPASNLQTVTVTSLKRYWDGFAVLFQPASSVLVGPPTVTPAFINQVLHYYHSPMDGQGQALYDLGVQYHVDPVFPLAFFMHESNFGTKGMAVESRSIGNLRCVPSEVSCDKGYAHFATWEDGARAWYVLMTSGLYIGGGLTTVEMIIPRYAPAGDNNDPNGYTRSVLHAVEVWRSQRVEVA
jgi:hypothetical protein